MTYTPELGQMIFGQPHQQNECPEIVEAALTMLRHEVQRVMWNLKQESFDPFGNTGDTFDCGEMSIVAYSWNDEANQLWNFRHSASNIEVSWYKYFGRGMSVNRKINPDEAAILLLNCLSIMKRVESGELRFTEPPISISYGPKEEETCE